MRYGGQTIGTLNAIVSICNGRRMTELCVNGNQIVIVIVQSTVVCIGKAAKHRTHDLSVVPEIQGYAKILFSIVLKDAG